MTKEELDKEFPEGVKAAIQRGKEIVMARKEKVRRLEKEIRKLEKQQGWGVRR